MKIAADNITSTNPAVMRAMEELDPAPIEDLAKKIAAAGPDFIDINPGFLSKKKLDRMRFLVETVSAITDVTLILDSPRAEVLKAGLSVTENTPVLSALTLEPEKLDAILPLAAESGADLVILLLDEKSYCPPDPSEKMAAAVELFTKAGEAGIPIERLIFDPVLPNLSWPDFNRHLQACVETVRTISSGALLGEPARTMAGVSNLLSGARTREARIIEQTLLCALVGAGLDTPLLNVLDSDLRSVTRILRHTMP